MRRPPLIIIFITLVLTLYLLAVKCFNRYSAPTSSLPVRHGGRHHAKITLVDMDKAPAVIIGDHDPLSIDTDTECTHYTCFNVYRCNANENDHMQVYVYPVTRFVNSKHYDICDGFSEEFWQILNTIVSSRYYTADPSSACLFVPSIDLLKQPALNRLDDTSRALNALPYWDRAGSNHLIFNLLPGSFPDYNRRLDMNTGRALIAGGGFDSWTYRAGFDISIPVYSSHGENKTNHLHPSQQHLQRNWLLITTQHSAMQISSQRTMEQLAHDHADQILVLSNHCPGGNALASSRCNLPNNVTVDYPAILKQATFCLIARTAYLGTPLLSDILMSGCIPVIAINEYIMPFEDLIDWKRVTLRIHESQLKDLVQILTSISASKIGEMRKQALFIWKTYFSTIKTITLTTLDIINDRLNPHTLIPKENRNHLLSLAKNQMDTAHSS